MPKEISKSVKVWSDGRYFVEKTPEIEAEVKKVCAIWKESDEIPGYNPFAKAGKMEDYKSDGYEIGFVTEHYGVASVTLYKEDVFETDATIVWKNYRGVGNYEVETTPEIEAEVAKVLSLYEETESMDKSDLFDLAKKMDEYNTPGFSLGYCVLEHGLSILYLYKLDTP